MDQTKEIIDRTDACLEIARKKYGIPLPAIPVKFDLDGRAAGMFVFTPNQKWFRYNRKLMSANMVEFLRQTVPHEVAHYVVHMRWGKRAAAHGSEWKSVMRDAFGLKPDRCHTMDLSALGKDGYLYKCACRVHTLTIRRHEKIRRGVPYKCRLCKDQLIFVRHEKARPVPKQMIERLFVSLGPVGLTESAMRKIRRLTASSEIEAVVFDHSISAAHAKRLIELLGIAAQNAEQHTRADTIPGKVSHAIVFECQASDRQIRIVTALKSRGVAVRYLQHA